MQYGILCINPCEQSQCPPAVMHYEDFICMFNGAQDLIDANDQKDELLDDGVDIDNRNIFGSE